MKQPMDKIDEIRGVLESRNWRLGLAESCTGGLLSTWLAQVPGISRIFQGAVVSYARDVKRDILGVPEACLQAYGEVSIPVAKAMARGAKKALSADWTVAITGVAGPSGGSVEKPVGTVCFAVCGPGFEETHLRHFPSHWERQEIQRQAAIFALDLLANALR